MILKKVIVEYYTDKQIGSERLIKFSVIKCRDYSIYSVQCLIEKNYKLFTYELTLEQFELDYNINVKNLMSND